MADSHASDRLAQRLARSAYSRRATIGALGGGALSTLGALRHTPSRAAAQATPTAGSAAGLDLDPETLSNIAQALWMPTATFDQLPEATRELLAAPKNSNAAFGERMRYYLQNLIDYPDSFTPSYADRYQALIHHADALSPHQAYVYTGLLGADKTRAFDPIPEQANLQFPQPTA